MNFESTASTTTGGMNVQEQHEFVGYEKREDAHEAQQHCKHEENHTIVRTFSSKKLHLFVSAETTPCQLSIASLNDSG